MRPLSAVLMSTGLMLTGCVAQADYDQLMAQNKSLAAEKELSVQRALDAETQAESIRKQIQLKERELGIQKELVSNLKSENDRLQEAFDRAQGMLEKVDFRPERPLVIQSTLPPELDSALQNFAASHASVVEYDPSQGVVKWKADLLFASGSDVVREDVKSTLRSFADVVNSVEATGFDVAVAGHTDNDPIVHAKAKGHPTNWHLSAHRAIAVAIELLSANVSPSRVSVTGYGEYRPTSANDTKDSKSQNRRVEIFLVGNTDNMARAQRQPQTNTNDAMEGFQK